MLLPRIIVLSLLFLLSSSMFCNYYPMDAKACIQKTDGVMCLFSQFENACLEASQTSYGCVPTLNKMACLNQLTDGDGNEASCFFNSKCLEAKTQHFKNLGCSDKYSKYACMNVQKKHCYWDNGCNEYDGDIPLNESCQQVFSNSVTPSLCQRITEIHCMSSGFQGDYQCINITDQQFSSIECTQLGLNELGCTQITTLNQACIFENYQCKSILPNGPKTCTLKLNRLACLQISDPKLKCQWKNQQCINFTDVTLTFEEINEVNPSVCSGFDGVCLYDSEKRRCLNPTNTQLENIKCNTFGITKQACLQIRNQYCTFFNGKCEELSKDDLSLYQCNMQLNQDACVNLKTEFQYCQWDGNECSRINLNQNIDCPIITQNNNIIFNGKVCQAISKPGVQCKYNNKTNLCERSTSMDYCDSPFINLLGCVSITRAGMSCQWTKDGCVGIKIISNQTTCSSLGFANRIACSQVYEGLQYGCYYEPSLQQCKSIIIADEEEIFLREITCNDTSYGLNKSICASILTEGQVCRWYQNQCQQIKNKEQIAQIQCISLQFVNQYACGLVEYGAEICRYHNSQKGCVNSIVQNMYCDAPGLNSYACAVAKGSCYFDYTNSLCKYVTPVGQDATVTTELLNTMKCTSSSPTIDICSLITTEGELCSWSLKASRCQNSYIPANSICQTFQGSNIYINANVCAAIINDFPDYDPSAEDTTTDIDRGYCKFNQKTSNCEVNTDPCTTPCCTEADKIGINAHSCSRYSTLDQTIYCYFGHNYRCQQLTADEIGVVDNNTVSIFYNENQFTCSQLTFNSCHMLNWSTRQRCYHNGQVCLNVKFNNYKDLTIFTVAPARLNEYACLSIEASITDKNALKYFEYDAAAFRCKPITPSDYAKCVDVKGNRNICLTYTSTVYCRWDQTLLKCVSMTNDEFQALTSCSQNQNKKACIENPNLSCQYLENIDSCVQASTESTCEAFAKEKGKVSPKVCATVTKDKQMCQFDATDKQCVVAKSDSVTGCNITGGNAIACYQLTADNNCRWDTDTLSCYEYLNDVQNLGCNDNINKKLCLQVTKETCVWNEDKYKCQKLETLDKNTFTSLSSKGCKFNKLTCIQLQGDSYQYSSDSQTCVVVTDTFTSCSQKSINKQACLNQTKGIKCYYDPNEKDVDNRCKDFTDDQTSCQSSTLINIEVCMQIPKQCYFDKNTQTCIGTTIKETVLCSDLKSATKKNIYYNYLSCASVSALLTQSDGQTQCNDDKNEQTQTCNYEKYCYWSESLQTCDIKILHAIVYEKDKTKKVCKDETTTDADGVTTTTEVCKDEPDPKCNKSRTDNVNYPEDCSRKYSKAICLEMSKASCYFDLNQGGCNPLKVDKLPSCDSISQICRGEVLDSLVCTNNCILSNSINALCKLSTSANQYPTNCSTLQQDIYTCTNDTKLLSSYKCEDKLTSPQAPIVCAKAINRCYYDSSNNKCSSNFSKSGTVCTPDCDNTFSKALCAECGCTFESGFCQKTLLPPQLLDDKSNLQFLCYEVNLLTKATQSEQLCGKVDYSCIYTKQCEDATGYTCSQIGGLTVSQRACIRCQGDYKQYDPLKLQCISISLKDEIKGCDNLNKSACLLYSKDKCRWNNYTCEKFTSIDIDDCNIYNTVQCLKVNNLCWIDPKTKICGVYDETRASCEDSKTQLHCTLSNTQSCYWDTTVSPQQCKQVTDFNAYTCQLANKYGCINMINKKCGWSTTNNTCYDKSDLNIEVDNCTQVISDNTDNIDLFNSSICSTLIVIGTDKPKGCFQDDQYKCQSASIVNKLKCNTQGVNEYACLNQTVGLCKYENNKCQYELNTNLDCSSELYKLNTEACLNQMNTCKYTDQGCELHTVTELTDIINDTDTFWYSKSVCTYLDIDESLIYNENSKRCINITDRNPYLNTCTINGINKNACLKKTTKFCGFSNNRCYTISKIQLSQTNICDPTFNWFACINLKSNCKFENGLCQSIKDEEDKEDKIGKKEACQDLADNNAIVSSKICQSRIDKPCKFNNTNNQCEIITTNQLCSTQGINQQGCIFQTSGSCYFNDNKCQNNYSDLKCSDLINKDKCLSIQTKLQYCYFDSLKGCINFPKEEDFTTCGQYSQTTYNPLICSLATDVACFYDQEEHICKPYNKDDTVNSQWSNYLSFNSLTCQQFISYDEMMTYWNDGCLEIPQTQLQYLTCESQVNQIGCLSITTPGEYCMFKDGKCHKITTFPEVCTCTDYTNINSGFICSKATDVPCFFNSVSHNCEEFTDTSDCSSIKGYNELACPPSDSEDIPDCTFNNNKCYLTSEISSNLFCSQANTLLLCQKITQEGCAFKNNICTEISDYTQINCTDAINEYGCLRISKIGQYCQYKDNKCINVDPKSLSQIECDGVGKSNNQIFCESVLQDDKTTGCRYDQKTFSCVFVESNQEFGCNRGLNIKSCLEQTTKSLQCQFLTFCYGPNYQILNCDTNKISDCCTLSSTIESCLFQNKFLCQWNNNTCSKYNQIQTTCDSIDKASITVCTNIQDSFCVFDITLQKCKSIQPITCDQAQTQVQCTKIEGVPCMWNIETTTCEYKEKQNYDECQDINTYGNKRACMDVERPGQLCQFIDLQCITFIETQNNCLNNINKVACTQQTKSDCIWKYDLIPVQMTFEANQINESQGSCQIFKEYDTTQCSDQLSYSSCLKITTLGQQCIWMDESCQQIQIHNYKTITSNTFVLINSNACSLVNNGDMVRYNIKTLSCIKETDFDNLTCSPPTPGLNKAACLKNTKQKCGWDDKNQTCIFKGKRLLVEEQIQIGRLLSQSSCKIDGLGPQLCSQLTFSLPCGSGEIGCDQIDVTQVTCDYKGLNKYGCLNLTTGPCVWAQNSDGTYGCQSYIPYGNCIETLKDVNSIVCSYVQDDSCVHDKSTYTCITPIQNYDKCEIDGINSIACSQIDGCIFKNQKCYKADINYNYQCQDLEQANYKVCTLAIDRCKYSELTHGCVKSTITDNCNTPGISSLGCNVLDQCKWGETSCLCLSYLQTFPVCSTLNDYTKCTNINYCYFEISKSIANKDLTQYLKNTNYGICRNKKCTDLDINNCQQTFINNIMCYQNSQKQCLEATKCEDIIGPSIDCSLFKFDKISCKTKKDQNQCEVLTCSLLDQQTCEQFQTQCVFVGYCKNRTCEYMGQSQCLQNDCDWNDQSQKCSYQLQCSQVTTSDKCLMKKQQGTQCAWIATLNKIEECTSTGCRFLGISQGDCMGTHIGTDVCVQMNDFSCVSCEEIKDSCICLNQSQFCSYDLVNQKCKSRSCQHHNQEDCPTTHCRFSTSTMICQPLCQYNYNQQQCNQADECVWDQTNKICVAHLTEIIIPQISLPAPNSNIILETALVFLIFITQ